MSNLQGPSLLEILKNTTFPDRFRPEANLLINIFERHRNIRGTNIEDRYIQKAKKLIEQCASHYQSHLDEVSSEEEDMAEKSEELGAGSVEEALKQVNQWIYCFYLDVAIILQVILYLLVLKPRPFQVYLPLL